jgi:predicted RNA methylase
LSAPLLAAARSDEEFDRVFPPPLQRLAGRHFTPLAVARRAAELLDARRVLDVGAGAGKLCIVGALASPSSFVGVERRAWLVDVGREIVRRHLVPRVELVCGDALSLDWSEFDGIYLYNPFSDGRLDESAPRRALAKLAEARPSTRVVTYHGLGGALPDGYRLLVREAAGSGQLEAWQKNGRP